MEFRIDPARPTPAYEQVVAQVVDAIADGRLAVGAKLPPVRALADEVGLAANTVAKAYKQLEAEGHVATRGRNGTVVLAASEGRPSGAVADAAAALVARAREAGLSLDETIGLVRRGW